MSATALTRHFLDPLDDALMNALLAGQTVAQAAATCGLPPGQAYQRYARPIFKAAYAEHRGEVLKPTITRLQKLLDKATDMIEGVMNDSLSKNADKLKAAAMVFEFAVDLADRAELYPQLATLHAAANCDEPLTPSEVPATIPPSPEPSNP